MILSIIAVVILFSIIILVHEAGHFFVAKRVGIRVEKFSLGFGPKLFAWKKSGTEYQVCLLPFGGFVKMAGEEYEEKEKIEEWEYMGKSPGHRAQVVSAGSINNLILGLILLIPVFMMGVPGYDGTRIGSFVEGLPAAQSGLMVGDRILKVNGIECKEWFDVLMNIKSAIERDNKQPVNLVVERDHRVLVFDVMPGVFQGNETEKEKKPVYILGISPMEKIEKFPFSGAVVRAGKEFYKMLYGIYVALKMLITRQVSAKQLSGPIGIAQWGGEIVHYGFSRFLYFMAFISVNLGVINLLPFPILDGGHLFGLIIERISHRRPSRKVLEVVGYLGFVLIIGLALYVTYNDILRVIEGLVKK